MRRSISPYLFLICAKGLSHKIKNYNLQGLKISQYGPSLTHLLCAIDTINSYEKSSCQFTNLAQSNIIFSPNAPVQVKYNIAFTLSVIWIKEPYKFLRLSLEITISKWYIFTHFKDRIASKIANWKEQLLSKRGKEVVDAQIFHNLLESRLPITLLWDPDILALDEEWRKGVAILMKVGNK